MKAPLIGGAALAAIAVIYLIVYGGSHLGSHSKGWEHYRAPNGEFELDVPKGWVPKTGSIETAFEMEGITEAFGPTGMFPPMVRYVVTVASISPGVTMDTLTEFAGHLNSRAEVLMTVGPGSYLQPKYPVVSQRAVEMSGLPAVEFELREPGNKQSRPRRICHRMAIGQGRLYSLHFEGVGKDYDRYVERFRQSAESFKVLPRSAQGEG